MSSALVQFGIVFGVIFALELLDRTNFTLIGLAARYRPWPVWLGAVAGFTAESLIAVSIGAVIGALLAGAILYLRLASGFVLIGYAAYLLLVPERPTTARPGATVFSTAFLLIFLLEFGDTTWIVGLNFALVYPVYAVAPAMILALASVAAIGCLIGSRLGARIEPKYLNRLTAIILTIVGVVAIASTIYPALLPGLPGSPGG